MNSYIDFDIQKELKKLPKKPGVYLMHGPSDEIIYVGKAVNLFNRVHQYFQDPSGKSPKIRRMISLIRRFEYIVVDSELEALVLENNLIKENRPKYNTLLKDDKTYPYIKVSVNEAYPRIYQTRKFRKDKCRYFGPYTSGLAVRDCIELLHKLFKIRTCSRRLPEDCGKERPCLYYHLNQCTAPCTGNVSEKEYNESIKKALSFLSGKYEEVTEYLSEEMKRCSENLEFEKAAEYRDLLKAVDALSVKQKVTANDLDDRDIIGIAKSDKDAVAMVFFLRQGKMIGREHYHIETDGNDEIPDIISAFINRYYTGTPYIPKEIWVQSGFPENKLCEEWLSEVSGHKCTVLIPKKGTKVDLVEMAVSNADIILRQDYEKIRKEELRTKGALNQIKELLSLPELRRVESFDISNTNGFNSVGSMVVFYDGLPKRNDYRKFRIKSVEGPNDYASMREVLERRFSHDEKEKFGAYPELILMDGGKGQVSTAESVINDMGLHINVAGMVKDDHHRTRGLYFRGVEIPIDTDSEGFHLITRIQDETHRFAIEYHKSLRTKEQVHSVLDDIEFIGPKRRRSLMKYFTDLQTIKNAGVSELSEIEGMDMRAAQSVYDFFHKKLPVSES